MKKYKCIESFKLERCDEDGFTIVGKYITIKKGTLWQRDDSGTILGTEVHLDSLNDGKWLDITEETLEEYFEEV